MPAVKVVRFSFAIILRVQRILSKKLSKSIPEKIFSSTAALLVGKPVSLIAF